MLTVMNVSTGVVGVRGVLDLDSSPPGVVALLWNASEGGDGNDSLEGVAAGILPAPLGGDTGERGRPRGFDVTERLCGRREEVGG